MGALVQQERVEMGVTILEAVCSDTEHTQTP